MGVWIETCETVQLLEQLRVTPCVGVWIETPQAMISRGLNPSHPAWVCGLKRLKRKITLLNLKVTPCVGVWIETAGGAGSYVASYVTPCVGVWIETSIVPTYQMMQLRHTLRGCVD